MHGTVSSRSRFVDDVSSFYELAMRARLESVVATR